MRRADRGLFLTAGPVTLDGSMGEGGGQILRSALGLALVTGRAFRIEKIRANRGRPGLRRQHLTAVEAAAAVGAAAVEGAALGSMELTFEPGPVTGGRYFFSVGSAGSATLVLQAVLPALLTAKTATELTLEGGTHNPHAPPYDFLARTFLPIVARLGPRIEATLERPGFFPAGGGVFRVRVEPVAVLQRLELMERGEIRRRRAVARVSRLPEHIARRELDVVRQSLGWRDEELVVDEVRNARGPGNVITLELESASVTEVFTGFGRRGVPAEAVARGAVEEARRYLDADVPVGEHLADQLLIPLALAGSGRFRTLRPSRHTLTHIDVVHTFLERAIEVTMDGADSATIGMRH